MRTAMVLVLVLVLCTTAFALEKQAYQMRGDFGTESLFDCALQYYYFIPCPTYSWFWAFSGWTPGDVVGACFDIGDQGTGGWDICDPWLYQVLGEIRVLDFAGYGTMYPGLFTFEMDVYCAGDFCCGSSHPFIHLWHSGPLESNFGWHHIPVGPGLCLGPCCMGYDEDPVIVVTATMVGSDGRYPAWGADNVGLPVQTGCVLHDIGCLPVTYPRGECGGSEPKVHSGFVGAYAFEYWPPLCFCDGADTTGDCTQYGCAELAWEIWLYASGPGTAAQPTTWSKIKTMYR